MVNVNFRGSLREPISPSPRTDYQGGGHGKLDHVPPFSAGCGVQWCFGPRVPTKEWFQNTWECFPQKIDPTWGAIRCVSSTFSGLGSFDSSYIPKSGKGESFWDHSRVKSGPKMSFPLCALGSTGMPKDIFLAPFVAVSGYLDLLKPLV